MKFFTMDWWAGIQDYRTDASVDPATEYEAHLRSLDGKLPETFARLNTDVSLQDCDLTDLSADPENRTLTLTLRGDDSSGGLRLYNIRYESLESFRSKADAEKGLPGPHGYGDLGYDETDVEVDGTLVHRILFSSGIEFEIRFGSFSISWTDQGVSGE